MRVGTQRYADLKALRARRQAEESEEPAARQQKHARKKADRSDKKKGTLTSMDDLGEMIAQAVKEKEEREAGEAGTPAEAVTADAGVAAAEIDPNESLKVRTRILVDRAVAGVRSHRQVSAVLVVLSDARLSVSPLSACLVFLSS